MFKKFSDVQKVFNRPAFDVQKAFDVLARLSCSGPDSFRCSFDQFAWGGHSIHAPTPADVRDGFARAKKEEQRNNSLMCTHVLPQQNSVSLKCPNKFEARLNKFVNMSASRGEPRSLRQFSYCAVARTLLRLSAMATTRALKPCDLPAPCKELLEWCVKEFKLKQKEPPSEEQIAKAPYDLRMIISLIWFAQSTRFPKLSRFSIL